MLKINLTLEEKLKKICNDKELFKKNFWCFRFSEALIECGQDLKEYADDTCWWGEKFFRFVLKSLKEANEYNKPLQKGILNCYFLFDNDDYDAVMYTYFDEGEWVEDVRQMALDKEIWQYEYIIDDEEDLKLE